MTMNISITKNLEEFVQEQVKTGLYSSASEVVRAGLRLLREREADVNKNIAISLKQFENGEYVEINDKFWEDIKGRVNERVLSYKKENNDKI
jgi:antitoxin ParD1/3/4